MILQLGTLSIFLHFKPMLTKLMNYIEIMNEVLIFISVYFMMIFTNWIQNIELRYSLGYSLNNCLIIVVLMNITIIVFCLVIEIYWEYKKYQHDKAWAKHNELKS